MMTRVDFSAAEPQYLTHIAPIWSALPVSVRGIVHTTSRLMKRCLDLGMDATTRRADRRSLNPVVVASYPDYQRCAPRPIIFVEHGAGQSYPLVSSHPAYSGGAGRDRTILFICPSDVVAERNQARYPNIPVAVVGCPALDAFHPPLPPLSPSLVAVTFHADLRLVPETASAFGEFKDAIIALARAGVSLLGHGHPRYYRRIKPFYDRYKIPSTPDLATVMEEAAVLVVDNSSAGFEFASLGRPLVWMSPSFYRPETKAWPRFWDGLVLGEHAQHPDQLLPSVAAALGPVPGSVQTIRDNFISTVYKFRDGQASRRAAEAIMQRIDR